MGGDLCCSDVKLLSEATSDFIFICWDTFGYLIAGMVDILVFEMEGHDIGHYSIKCKMKSKKNENVFDKLDKK